MINTSNPPNKAIKPIRYVDRYERQDNKTVPIYSCGYLLEFTTDYEELTNGIGQYPAAIIQTFDGHLIVRPVEQCQFVTMDEYIKDMRNTLRSQ